MQHQVGKSVVSAASRIHFTGASLLWIFVLVAGYWQIAKADGIANPALFARAQGIESEKSKRSLRLATLQIDVAIKGSIASTTLKARFTNTGDEISEGEFSLALPEGAVVTGYALDINGRMIDGVLADIPKAREIYEDRIRAGIDPGIATVTSSNVFSTRVFPIREKTGRTISVTFVSPITAAKGWTLPLSTDRAVGKVSLSVRADAVKEFPSVALPTIDNEAWQPVKNSNDVLANTSNKKLNGELRITSVTPSAALLISKHSSGKAFFQLRDKSSIVKRATSLSRLRVYWDRSRSRRDQSIAQEVALLRSYIAATKPTAIDVVVFNSRGAKMETKVDANGVADLLSNAIYRGGTSFAVLDGLKLAAADACLMFSDGVATVGSRDSFKPDCRLTAIASAADADRAYLRRLAEASGGGVMKLSANTTQELLAQLITQLGNRIERVVDVRDQSNGPLPFAVISSSEREWIVVGEAPASGPIVVKMSGTGAGTISRRYEAQLISSANAFDGVGALWAANRIADLAAQDNKLSEVRELSKLYSIANTAMAFLVLESPEDYAMSEIAPPKNYPAHDLKLYRVAKAEHDKEQAAARDDRINVIRASWVEQKKWWNTKFSAAPKRKAIVVPNVDSPSAAIPAPAAEMASQNSTRMEGLADHNEHARELESVVVTGSLVRQSAQGVPVAIISAEDLAADKAPKTRIALKPWNPKRPYLKALDGAKEGNVDATLLAQEKLFGNQPAFYFDVAEWFKRKHRDEDAEELVLSALELPAHNEDTSAIVADRLLRYGRYDLAIELYEKHLTIVGNLPQPRRALALALIKRAQSQAAIHSKDDLLRALHLLNEIVMSVWSGDYDGIELIALMDANAIIPALQKAGVKKLELDSRLIALLDVDLRVVIEWNTGNTDIDLWINEPNGERVIYSNPSSSSGGRLSNDMTSGYGPEEYLLHHAPAGKYQIRLNVYAADRINPNGATIVTAHLIRDYGRSNQREETIDLELKAGDEGEKLVGEFEVKR